jgi:hypothetical protein
MTDKTDRRAVHIGKLMAATSALAISLGMTAQADAASNQDKHVTGQTSTQIKGESNQEKWTGFLKHNTNDHKISTQIKLDSVQHKVESTQIKLHNTNVVQHKHDTPSTQLNPQPEPPMQTGPGTTPH